MKVWKKIFEKRYTDITNRTALGIDFPTNAHLFYAWNTKTSITSKGRWEISVVNNKFLLVVDKQEGRKYKVMLIRYKRELGISWKVFVRPEK